MTIAAFCGSLRKHSLNRSVVNHMDQTSDDIQVLSLEDIPLFNADLEEQGEPEAVFDFKKAIKEAEAVLIVTPEYSHSMPGVLKNALDWAGSMTYENVLDGKPVMIAGASPSVLGTAFAQEHLRVTLAACGAHTMPQPEIFIGKAAEKIDKDGKLIDQGTIDFLESALNGFRVYANGINNL
ncbi:NADPH-dependent FMN reductase [Salisediminibacterium beveridgei]|uniref:FMN reductase n=1 Tax=Salisediminibacterium beveridgei TaxID=632773 RepID=A0A1D7QWH9_9BACI|nr:NADPH-dependent FMN reductase [Salisediminibacterium beveridgei]AOM83365.1 FMN reductase [Salisediminibacterium beveridgei]